MNKIIWSVFIVIIVFSNLMLAQDLTESILAKGLRNPLKTEAADVDGDGLVDAVVRTSDQELNWLRNEGGGEFSYPMLISNDVLAFNLFDRDNDGDADILLCSATEGIILLKSDNGSFELSDVISVEDTNRASPHFADMDGDGDLDVVTCGFTGGKIYWYEYTEEQAYEPAKDVTGFRSNRYQIDPVDVDGDDDIDVIASSDLSGTRLYRNNGDGTFAPHEMIADDSRSIHVVDMDGDDDPDFLYTELNTIIRLYTNDGAGNFSPQSLTTELWAPTDIIGTDLDNDGDKDVVVVSFNFQSVYRMKQTSTGNFEDPVEILDAFNNDEALAVGDFYDEGSNSLLAISRRNSLITLIRNTGTGSFTDGHFVFPKFIAPVNGHHVDINNDGAKDIVFSADESEKVFVARGICAGGFEPPAPYLSVGEEPVRFLRMADLDLDGDEDILLYQESPNEVKYAMNDGNGNFGSFEVLYDDFAYELEIADLTGDELPDIIVRKIASSEALIYYPNLGNGTFGDAYVFNHVLAWSGDVEVGDVEGDGDLDVFQNRGQGRFGWYINEGDGTFGEEQTFDDNASLGFSSYNLRDADDDGDLDIFIARFTNFKVGWYENPGDNQFTPTRFNDLPPRSINLSTDLLQAWADVDNDGLDDFIVNDRGGNPKFLWYKNLGSGAYASSVLMDEISKFSLLQGLDIEDDNDDDVLLFGLNNHQISILENSFGTADTLAILVDVEAENIGPCFDDSSGFIQLSTNATACEPYAISWSEPGLEGFTLENLAPDLYKYTVTNAFGISLMDSVAITAPEALILAGDATTSAVGNAEGMAWVTVSGGLEPYAYSWSDAAMSTSDTISNLNPGTYTVTVTDTLGCTQSLSVTVEMVTGTEDALQALGIRVYPTLVNGHTMTIQRAVTTHDLMHIEIINSVGQRMKKTSFSNLQTINQVDVSELKNGIYYFITWSASKTEKAAVPFVVKGR